MTYVPISARSWSYASKTMWNASSAIINGKVDMNIDSRWNYEDRDKSIKRQFSLLRTLAR